MNDTSDFSKVINPKDLDDIRKVMDGALSKAIYPEDLDGIRKEMDTALSRAIDPKYLESVNQVLDTALSRAIDPKNFESVNHVMNAALSRAIDPKYFESVINLPISDFSRQIIPSMNIPISTSYAQLSFEEQKEFHSQSLNLLKDIRDNTGNLSTIVDLIADNNDKQEIIIKFISQMLEIATARNQEELNSKFEKVLENIKNSLELGELTGKLLFYAYTIFTLVAPNIGK